MDVSLGTGPWGSGGGWSQGWCLSTFLRMRTSLPLGGHPTLIQEQKSSGRKKSLPSIRCGSLRPLNLQGRNWAASQCLPSPPPVLLRSAQPSHRTLWPCSHQALIL